MIPSEYRIGPTLGFSAQKCTVIMSDPLYSLPIFWSESEINLLPVKCQFDVRNELKEIKSKFKIVENLLNEFNPKAIIDYESFIWAYATGKWLPFDRSREF